MILLGNRICMKLAKAQRTDSGRVWILTFVEPRYRFMQTIMFPMWAEAGMVEALVEKMWEDWTESARERDWMPFI